MTTYYSVSNPFMQILNLSGTGLNDGDVYFGVAGQDPITHPITVYWDMSGTTASQPIATTGGYLYRSGTPAAVFVNAASAEYSIKVLDKNGATVYYEANVNDALATFMASLATTTNASLTGDVIGLFTSASGSVIRSGATFVQTIGYSSLGVGAASYLYDAAVNSAYVSAHPLTSFLSADSRGWRLDIENGVSVTQCGAKGDNSTNDQPAFQAAHDILSPANSYVGNIIRVPASSSGYYLASTWNISKRVTIQGANSGDQVQTAASALYFAQDTNGIRLFSNIDSSTGTGADRSRISGLNISARAKNVSGIGIYSTCVVEIEYCIVRVFKGDGIYIHGQTGAGATGIADASTVRYTRSVSNGGDGLHLDGNDSNVCTTINFEASSNGGWAINDNSKYGCTHINPEAAGNITGSYNVASSGAVLINPYIEGGTGDNTSFNAYCLVLNGTGQFPSSPWVYGAPAGININTFTGGRIVFQRNGVEIGRIETTNSLDGLSGANFTGGVAGRSVAIASQLITHTTELTSAQDQVRFINGNGNVGNIQVSGTATAFNTSSDKDLKKNFRDFDSGAIIDALYFCEYDRIEDDSTHHGVAAQDAHKVYPHPVSPSDEPGGWMVDYSKFVPVIGNQSKKLRQRCADLEALVQSMADRLDALEKKA